jgi:hypothetical protein
LFHINPLLGIAGKTILIPFIPVVKTNTAFFYFSRQPVIPIHDIPNSSNFDRPIYIMLRYQIASSVKVAENKMSFKTNMQARYYYGYYYYYPALTLEGLPCTEKQ